MRDLAIEVFERTDQYDRAIYEYLSDESRCLPFYHPEERSDEGAKTIRLQGQQAAGFPEELVLSFDKLQDLRYGENPHQKAAFYREKGKDSGLINLRQLQGKGLSFNNILDLNCAFELLKEFKEPAAVIVKHNNPCGVAQAKTIDKAYLASWKSDSLSAFGGIIALNRRMDIRTAKAIAKSGFLECIIVPGFDKEALAIFKDKKNLRLLELNELSPIEESDFKRVSGGLLLQDKDLAAIDANNLKIVTKKKPTKKQIESLIFGFKVAKHVKSNAIVLTRGTQTVGIGAGQMSRVDSVILARKKAGKLSENSCLASDAFFPKPDAIKEAANAGVKAIIQPGGSVSDEEIIKVCDKHKIAMVFTGIRHFKH
jgi:phosphoribosylaminoimidazolecarboxamide formyltransferase/IMP cyclohydrolase